LWFHGQSPKSVLPASRDAKRFAKSSSRLAPSCARSESKRFRWL
jgi:hypothetical protein